MPLILLICLLWPCKGFCFSFLEREQNIEKILTISSSSTMLTDAELPRMDPKEVGLFYDLLIKVEAIFKTKKLFYWATCGSLLGAERHGGMIPWDDDIDLAIFEDDAIHLTNLKDALADKGLELFFYKKFGYFKIYSKKGMAVQNKKGKLYPWRYPFIDIFPMKQIKGKICYADGGWRRKYPKEYFFFSELKAPLPQVSFGPLSLPVPHQAKDCLVRMYGADWNEVAYVDYFHKEEKSVKRIKVKLVDRSPPPYILPSE